MVLLVIRRKIDEVKRRAKEQGLDEYRVKEQIEEVLNSGIGEDDVDAVLADLDAIVAEGGHDFVTKHLKPWGDEASCEC